MLNEVLKSLELAKNSRFASIVYRSKESGELAKHRLLFGVNLERIYRRDLRCLCAKVGRLEGIEKLACEELIASIKESLAKGIGQNSAYTRRESHTNEGNKGEIQVANDGSNVLLRGYSLGKVVIEPGTCKSVKSSEKTIAKNKLRKSLKMGKIRTFSINVENIKRLAVSGATVEIES